MEQQPLSRKIKLKLVQPNIMCAGRKPVSGTFKGRITKEYENGDVLIEFKFKGEQRTEIYVKDSGFTSREIQDLKLQ